MSTTTQPNSSFSAEEQIWNLIMEIAGDKHFTPECEAELWQIVKKGVQQLRFEFGTGESAKALEVKDNYRLLIETMKLEAGPDAYYLDTSHFERALEAICPLFPIC